MVGYWVGRWKTEGFEGHSKHTRWERFKWWRRDLRLRIESVVVTAKGLWI